MEIQHLQTKLPVQLTVICVQVTKASVEREEWGAGSLCSRLPSNLSLGGSSTFVPTPAPTTPHSLWPAPSPGPANRSVTPVLFPEHQLRPCGLTRQQLSWCSLCITCKHKFRNFINKYLQNCIWFILQSFSKFSQLNPRDPNKVGFQFQRVVERISWLMKKVSKWHRDYCCVTGAHPLIFLPLRLIITLPPPQIIWCHTAREKSGDKMSTSIPHRNPIGVYTNKLSRHDYRGKKWKVVAMTDTFLGPLASAWPSPPLTMRPGPPSGGIETRRCSTTWSSSGPASQVSSPESDIDICDENRIWRPALKSAYFSCLQKNNKNRISRNRCQVRELLSSQFIITISCLTSFWKILDKWGILNHVPHNFVTFSRHRKWDVDMWTFSWWW